MNVLSVPSYDAYLNELLFLKTLVLYMSVAKDNAGCLNVLRAYTSSKGNPRNFAIFPFLSLILHPIFISSVHLSYLNPYHVYILDFIFILLFLLFHPCLLSLFENTFSGKEKNFHVFLYLRFSFSHFFTFFPY